MKEYYNTKNSKKIQVLIISDRLLDEAKVLAGYLRCTGTYDIVGIAENRRQALSIAQKKNFDYLIVAGYLKMEQTYRVIAEFQQQQREFLPVQWAMLDSLINTFCERYKIPLKFERTFPLSDFVNFLDAHKNDPIPCCPD